jgi:hypothetical protein
MPTKSKNLSWLADLSLHIGSHDGNDLTRTTYLFGGRWMFDQNDGRQRHLPFVQGLIGGIHDSASVGSNAFAGELGGGWEYFPHGIDRTAGVAVRIQVDYIFAINDKAFTRVTGGVVYRIGGPKAATP